MSNETESSMEQIPEPERLVDVVKNLASAVAADCRAAWEVSRPETPEIPFFHEVVGDWNKMSDMRGRGSTPPA